MGNHPVKHHIATNQKSYAIFGYRLRTCLMATHTDADIDKALDAFEESGKALGLI